VLSTNSRYKELLHQSNTTNINRSSTTLKQKNNFIVMSNELSNSSNDGSYATQDTSMDFVESTEADVVSLAVVCIWVYLIRK
jgi:hypothetical protein